VRAIILRTVVIDGVDVVRVDAEAVGVDRKVGAHERGSCRAEVARIGLAVGRASIELAAEVAKNARGDAVFAFHTLSEVTTPVRSTVKRSVGV